MNPDILIGYNVFGFDESYLWYRAEELNLISSNSPIHQLTRLFALSSEVKLEEKFLSSSAMGDNRMYIWTLHGRLQIDLFHYIKRNNVLSSYKLDEVTKHFMSGKLKSQAYIDNTLTLDVAGAIKDVKPGRAISLLDDTGETVSPKLVVETVDGSKITFKCELDADALNEMVDATKWVIVKDDVSPQDIFRLHRESSKGRAIVGKYCLPEDDHQILTNYGYMYLYELQKLWGENINQPPSDKNLLLAGYNTETKQIIYERPNSLILNDYCINQDMIEFTQNTYSEQWDSNNIFGLNTTQLSKLEGINIDIDTNTKKVPNYVSLITTPEHDMYARCGTITGNKPPCVIMTSGSKRIPIPFIKIKANELIGNNAPTAIKLLSRAENGLSNINYNNTTLFNEKLKLNLNTTEKQIAFLELYGYWLGDGSILLKRNKLVSITFNIVKESDVSWLKNIFIILELKNTKVYKNTKLYELPDSSDGKYKIPRQSQYLIQIKDQSYIDLFFNEYGNKYLNKTLDNEIQLKAFEFATATKIYKNNTNNNEYNTNTQLHSTQNNYDNKNENIKSAKWMMKWVWELNKEESRAIINGIVRADGSHYKGKELKHIFTSSTRFRDEVERLALHAGYSPYSTVGYLAGTLRGYTSCGTPIIANHTSWNINFPEDKQFSEPTLKREEGDIKKIKYTGRTWCVSMPSTFIIARRAKCLNNIISHASRPLIIGNCLQDCDLVIDLYKKLETFNNTMCMANVCSVPLSYIFTRGQGIKIESLIFKACKDRDIVIPVLTSPRQGTIEDSYEGAIVLTPEPGFYSDSPIGVCDFASLYPSTIVSENISHDSLLWIKDFNYDGTLISHNWGSEVYDECEGYAYTDIEFDIWRPDPKDTRKHPVKVRCGRRICRYAQPLDGTKSTLPQITTWLLQAREAKKKEMKSEKDPERYALLDAEQLAYKLTGNSLYGQLGSGTFKIRLQALAASVTSYGRKQILFAKDAIEKFYGPGSGRKDCSANVMYGDTDSLFVEFNVRNPETGLRLEGREARQATIDITDEAGAFITKTLAAPHDFEFDKAFDPMLMFSKKRYAGNMYENNADDYVHKYMGIALKRRDNAPIVKTIFGGAMKMLLDKRDVDGAFKFVKDKCMELVEGKVSLGQLTVTKSLRADYANPLSIAHKVLANRITQRDPGNAPAAGDRIGYVYISPKSGQEASKLQGDRIETPLYAKDNNLIPDYKHYIEHQLQNPISQAFGLLLERIPGFNTSMLSKCPVKPDVMDGSLEADKMLDSWLGFRENIAAQLLFSDCLKKFENSSRRNAIINMFGNNTVLTTSKSSKISKSSVIVNSNPTNNIVTTTNSKPAVQITMSSFLLDSMIVDNMKRKERAAASAAKKKIKDQMNTDKN
jgi:DNA polymerase elongation subunit (family B)